MNAAEIVAELSARGVSVAIVPPDRIRLTVQAGDVPTEAVALARDHKPVLIEHLRPSCQPHNNPANYIDEPAPNRPGWIRSTCRVCGRFVGYREGGASPDLLAATREAPQAAEAAVPCERSERPTGIHVRPP